MSKIQTKIDALVAKITELKGQLQSLLDTQAAEAALANIAKGARVSFEFGRGETKATLVGEVVFVVDGPNGKLLKVLAGEGASVKVYDVAARNVTPVAEVAEPAPVVEEQAPVVDEVAALVASI